ncbi:MAG: sensor histidine kinase [Oligoflexus sp.]
MLGQAICKDIDGIIDLWYAKWKDSSHPHPEVSEAALKDHLPLQLRLIGEQLHDISTAEDPSKIWKLTDRLDPEARVSQDIPIEEVVQEYHIFMIAIREWIASKKLEVSFNEFSYLFQSIFELTAESVRRYSKYQAEQVLKYRKDYLASLAHQMRTPLGVVANQIEILEMEGDLLDVDSIERLKRNINRLLFMVNGVMRLERFKVEEIPVHPRFVYPSDLLDKILQDHQFDARHKDLSLEISVNRSLKMKTDQNLFVDALGNLIENAIKYTKNGFVSVKAEEQDQSVLFTVEDSGPGISKERQKELFQPTQPQSAEGAGIGLTIVQRAVTALGGSVEVKSELDKGSTFYVRLPKESSPKNIPTSIKD